MKVKINNTEITLADGATVAEALEAQKIKPQGIAVAVNGTIVAKTDYENHHLMEGDTLLIIKAFYGG